MRGALCWTSKTGIESKTGIDDDVLEPLALSVELNQEKTIKISFNEIMQMHALVKNNSKDLVIQEDGQDGRGAARGPPPEAGPEPIAANPTRPAALRAFAVALVDKDPSAHNPSQSTLVQVAMNAEGDGGKANVLHVITSFRLC